MKESATSEELNDSVEYKMLTIAKAAKLLGISSDDVKELLLDPELPRLIFNRGRVRLPRRGLLDYIKRRTQNWYD